MTRVSKNEFYAYISEYDHYYEYNDELKVKNAPYNEYIDIKQNRTNRLLGRISEFLLNHELKYVYYIQEVRMMKKIPTLFKRIYENHKVVGITDEVTEGCEFVLEGKGTPTVKYDGSCCAIIGGQLYKRYAKKGKKAPEGAIPCQDAPDEITGHFPHWVKCDHNNPTDKWFFKAYEGSPLILSDGTYEAIGEHFQGNPYHLKGDTLVKHGEKVINAKLDSFEIIKEFLKNNEIEGIVFWLDGEPRCKIKRSDFGFLWGCK